MILNAYPFKDGRQANDLSDKYKKLIKSKVGVVYCFNYIITNQLNKFVVVVVTCTLKVLISWVLIFGKINTHQT